jgi:hypothetical protein
MKKFQPIEILWIDSVHTSKWQFEDNVPNLTKDKYLKQKTIGYFFSKSKKSIVVVQSMSNDGEEKHNVDAIMQIPLKAVQKIRKI